MVFCELASAIKFPHFPVIKGLDKIGAKHIPTDELRAKVRERTAAGIGQESISKALRIDKKTLRLYYRAELDDAHDDAVQEMARSLYDMGTKDKNVTAAIFWLKTRARWSEARPDPVDAEDKGTLVINIVGGLPKRDR